MRERQSQTRERGREREKRGRRRGGLIIIIIIKTRALTRSQSRPAEKRRVYILAFRLPIDQHASRELRLVTRRSTAFRALCAPALRSSSLRLWVASPTPAGPTCYSSWRLSAARRNFPNSSASRRKKRSGSTSTDTFELLHFTFSFL